MPHRYRAFGAELSSDLVLPELTASESASDSQVQIQRGDHEQWPELDSSPHSTPTLQLAPQDWRLELEGIGWFRATGGERLEWQRWDDSVSDRDIRAFAVTSGLGALAIQRGALVLHGTALERDGEAILLLGHPAAGKSTLAWSLLQNGWRLLSSELVAVSPDGLVQPGMHQLKLWHDAALALELNWALLPPVRKGLKRYALLAEDLACTPQPAPLRLIYGLNRAKEDSRKGDDVEGGVEKEKLSIKASLNFYQTTALMRLRNQAFHARMYRGMAAEPQLFMQAAALARTVPLHALTVPDGIEAMAASLKEVDLMQPESMQQSREAIEKDASNE
ncbi:hypothetical protein SynBIOSE41_02908 [Synechococcus sp. BIOS-E4-1]|uniref:hypothetical protein n=1 Tax=Synechococcus sp. BIOS-E4-1 TaxID=1400864 RepID=UPI0018614E5E|nr:hypothetical protein [Synechococcus sp. BIOS-E4-1]QNI55395.1 hypothetical protein SynBIOSE41_02908 [Synechococcus sp. BIOS-E4-1]